MELCSQHLNINFVLTGLMIHLLSFFQTDIEPSISCAQMIRSINSSLFFLIFFSLILYFYDLGKNISNRICT